MSRINFAFATDCQDAAVETALVTRYEQVYSLNAAILYIATKDPGKTIRATI
ncbi:protein of unknown function (plasmid) [Pararobbsia alpina]